MQLGARWAVGDPPHRSVPAAMHALIVELEQRHPSASAWTLTWLEGLPRVALDDVLVLTVNRQGETQVLAAPAPGAPGEIAELGDDDDRWLEE